MVTCPSCGRFVKVNRVEVWWLSEEIKRVDATCKRHGAVDALFTDYDELVDGENNHGTGINGGNPAAVHNNTGDE